MSQDPPRATLPALPAQTRGAPRAFHTWCSDELSRRQTRDVELDLERFERAVRLVLSRLGAGLDAP